MTPDEFLSRGSPADVQGVATAKVTNNNDPEGLGRVKVTYPWRDANDESFWARRAVPMAGSGRGTFFLPEVEDEVLVGFEEGDLHHPFVVGSLWNGKDEPPTDNADGNNNVRMIQSRRGHKLLMDDAESGGKFEITTDAGHRIVLDDSSGSERIEITDQSEQNTIRMENGAVEITSDADVTIDSRSLKLKGDSIDIESTGSLTIEGRTVDIK